MDEGVGHGFDFWKSALVSRIYRVEAAPADIQALYRDQFVLRGWTRRRPSEDGSMDVFVQEGPEREVFNQWGQSHC